MKKYKLQYLPLAEQDLAEIIDYIQNNLQNPIAAENTLNKIENSIIERLESPESFAIWQSSKNRKYPYRRINVPFSNQFSKEIDKRIKTFGIIFSNFN